MISEAVSRLTALVDRMPLEELPEGTRANARQRSEASHQIGLWIAARECLAQPEYRDAGTKLATRALDAAKRQVDRKFALAVLREWGRILLDQGDRARKEVSMAKVQVADTLQQAADVGIQLNGARGYSKDTVLEWIYRASRAARLVDGASEVHNMVLARFMREEGRDFWSWSAGNRV